MKTEKEIQKRLDKITSPFPMTENDFKTLPTLVDALVWVLDDSKVLGTKERTIFDLTLEELEELFYIATDNRINSNILGKIYEHDFAIDYMYSEHNQYISQDIQFRIYKNHDFVLISDGIKKTINNQVRLHGRLNEILNIE